MKKLAMVANTSWYLYNFRLDFLSHLRAAGYEIFLVAPEGEYSALLKKSGYRVLPLPLDRKGMNPLAELASLLALYRIYKQEKPDIVHHHTVKCALYGTVAAVWARVPCVVNSITGLGHLFLSQSAKIRFVRAVLLQAYRRFSRRPEVHFIFQNSDDRALFQRLRVISGEHGNTLVRGSGVNLRNFSPLYGSGKTILFAARLLREKGLLELVEALGILRKKGVPFEFLCAGSPDPGNPSAIPAEQLRQWQESGLVHLLGHVDPLVPWVQKSDIVVLPSWREGLPRVLLEGAAAGKALLATDVPGCREVVENGSTGLLVPPRSPSALAEALERLLSDPGLRRRLGEAARAKVEQEFAQEIIFAKTENIYRNCLRQA